MNNDTDKEHGYSDIRIQVENLIQLMIATGKVERELREAIDALHDSVRDGKTAIPLPGGLYCDLVYGRSKVSGDFYRSLETLANKFTTEGEEGT